MIKTETDILYNGLKNSVGFHRSKKFKEWFHNEFPGYEQHHGAGSYTGIKTSDYFSMPVTSEQHTQAEKDKSAFCMAHLPDFINTMQKYIIYLERKCK